MLGLAEYNSKGQKTKDENMLWVVLILLLLFGTKLLKGAKRQDPLRLVLASGANLILMGNGMIPLAMCLGRLLPDISRERARGLSSPN